MRPQSTCHGLVAATCLTCGHHTREVGAVEMWNDYGTACPRPGCPAHAAGGPVEFEHADGTTTAATGS